VGFSFVFYFVYSYFREQACIVVCPYGRLQSVLLDRNSMVVAYDYKRGEPRAKYTKEETSNGDCIDCHQCVNVCPTGIDIRNGTQMECVGCTSCIDACNTMMEATNKPKGLIRYASENGIENGEKLHFTARMKFYTVLLILLTGLLTTLLVTRSEIEGTILKTGGQPYFLEGTDSISNQYKIEMINKTDRNITIKLKLENSNIGTIRSIGNSEFHIAPGGQSEGNFFIVLPQKAVTEHEMKFNIGLYDGDKKIQNTTTNFLGPFKNRVN
jgi:cytochrome c oxidase accessory protein FixG